MVVAELPTATPGLPEILEDVEVSPAFAGRTQKCSLPHRRHQCRRNRRCSNGYQLTMGCPDILAERSRLVDYVAAVFEGDIHSCWSFGLDGLIHYLTSMEARVWTW